MLEGWTDFYFLLGSAAAGLIGLLFVVVTLTAGVQSSQTERGQALYMTPTVFHFAAVLAVSAFCTSERVGVPMLSLIIGAASLFGFLYMAHRTIKLRSPQATQHWSDFWYYGVLPLAGYAGMAVCAWAIRGGGEWAPEALATLMLAILLLGIRNAWDLVTWIAPRAEEIAKGADAPKPPNAGA